MCIVCLRGNGTYLAVCIFFSSTFFISFSTVPKQNEDTILAEYGRLSYSLDVRCFFLAKLTLPRHTINYQCFANYFGPLHYVWSIGMPPIYLIVKEILTFCVFKSHQNQPFSLCIIVLHVFLQKIVTDQHFPQNWKFILVKNTFQHIY